MSRRRRFVAIALSAPLVLAACGNNDANAESLEASLIETAEVSPDDAKCISDAVFADEYVLTLDQDQLNNAANEPESDPEFQAVVDTALASCLGL